MTAARRVAWAAVAVAVAGWLLWQAAEHWLVSEEARVRRVIAAMARAFEAEDARGVCAHLSPSYQDAEGNDPSRLRLYLNGVFHQRNPTVVQVRDLEARVVGERATARLTATVVERGAEELRDPASFLPLTGETWWVEADFALEDGEWRLVTHRRGPGTGSRP
ncbi:MAG: hypothetical protein HY722_15730 [Planctomycetes bacterium]|nr:hypothetical protein [Planctomycetota bacterium]